MIIQEADLFRGVTQTVTNEIASICVEEVYKAGEILFETGQSAEYLYVIEDGSIDIVVGEAGSVHFVADESGEAFGWSALIEPFSYTASAKCISDSKLIKLSGQAMEDILKKYPADGLLIMRHLAGIIAERLRNAYQNISAQAEPQTRPSAPSYG